MDKLNLSIKILVIISLILVITSMSIYLGGKINASVNTTTGITPPSFAKP